MIIFVAGIHGVGKTFLGVPAAEQLGIRHATASQLIREERGLVSWGIDKRVSGIDENQVALISAASRLRSSGNTLLLDGHFVLRQKDGQYEQIELQVFRDLQIGAVVLLHADTKIVHERLVERGDTSWSHVELDELARREEEHAHKVTTEMGIRIRSLHAPSQGVFRNTIADMLEEISPNSSMRQ